MSAATTSAASSTVTRSRTAIALLAVTIAGYGIYCVYKSESPPTQPNAAARGLHRSNAIHRRRRRLREAAMEDHDDDRNIHEYTSEDEELPETMAPPLADGETVIGENMYDDDDQPRARSGRNHMQLLFQVSENETRRNAYVHRGLTCNYCGDLIRGIRYRCTNCIDFDLCEICEDQQRHTKTHIFVKIRVPLSYYASKEVQPVSYPGNPDRPQEPFPKELLGRLSRETGFEGPEVQAFWEQFQFTANTEWLQDPDGLNLAMDRITFDQCLIPSSPGRYAPPNLLHDRMFAFYDSNGDGLIGFPEYLHGLAYRKQKEKLKKVFEGYDIDEDGYVDRKDFLRLFRCYYVLYKDLQRDMLEGIQDQVLHSLEGTKLVSGRQPLSSAFGHDGNFSPRGNPRAGQGKRVLRGEEVITDDKGVILENWNELGNREDVFRLVPSNGWTGPRTVFDSNPIHTETYWEHTLSPPGTIEELNQDVLERLIESRIMSRSQQAEQANNLANGDEEENQEEDEDIPDDDWPPDFVETADILTVTGSVVLGQRVPRETRAAIIAAAQERIKQAEAEVRKEIYERWRRRAFYTDEEEGGVPPADWNDDDDVATHVGSSSEQYKQESFAPRPISPRSRSSSKVRFAEDTDDFETRSNPSTSSRSVPERWGGMEIPEAEKDAGKEILYQVAQQAFNELLDPIFKRTEDRAMSAMASRDERALKEYLLSIPAFLTWAEEVDNCIEKLNRGSPNFLPQEIRVWLRRPQISEVELEHVRQRPLDQLLEVTGYSVDPEISRNMDEDGGGDTTDVVNADPSEQLAPASEAQTNNVDCDHDEIPTTDHEGSPHPPPSGLTPSDNDDVFDTSYASGEADESGQYHMPSPRRDPTLPQFRPNTESELSIREPNLVQGGTTPLLNPAVAPPSPEFSFADLASFRSVREVLNIEQDMESIATGDLDEGVRLVDEAIASARREAAASGRSQSPRQLFLSHKASIQAENEKNILRVKELLSALRERCLAQIDEKYRDEMMNIDWMDLYKLREDQAVTLEASLRKGWGRLNWEEFQTAVKDCEDLMAAKGMNGRGRGRSLDYLGSWIEFCIP